jgi:hypothetical protein
MLGVFEYFKILTAGLLVVLGFYFFFEIPTEVMEIPEAEAGITATTSLSVGNASPTVSGVILNGGSNIRLIESSATTVVATCTVTDTNGYSDINSVVARLYRSGVTSSEACTQDGSNCYGTSTCATSSCAGNDCVATCNFNVWFIAEPTDAGSDWSGETWEAWIQATDSYSSSSSATNSSEMNTLTALDVTDSINYGSLSAGGKNDPLDKLALATTTGNEAIDASISGTNMCTDYPTCTVSTSITYQKYATTTAIGYNSSTAQGCYTASSSAISLEFVTVKPTATPSNQAQSIYWGTLVPTGTSPGTFEGVNTFSAASDS